MIFVGTVCNVIFVVGILSLIAMSTVKGIITVWKYHKFRKGL